MTIGQLLTLILILGDGLKNARALYTVSVGKDITVSCWFYFPGSNKLFCKNDCNNKENILVQTSGDRKQKGRYSIEYRTNVFYIMDVTIKNVTEADSGRHLCKFERSVKNGFYEFEIGVTHDAISSNQIVILKPSVVPSTVFVTSTLQTFPFRTVSTETPTQSEHDLQLELTTAPPSAASEQLLHVGVTLTVIVIILSLASLVLYLKRRNSKTKEIPVKRENTEKPEADRLYEEIQDDVRQSGPHIRVDRASEIYSLATAPLAQLHT